MFTLLKGCGHKWPKPPPNGVWVIGCIHAFPVHLVGWLAHPRRMLMPGLNRALVNPSTMNANHYPLFSCISLRSLNRLHCQQAVLDKLGQWHYQQVQSGWQRAGSTGDSKEGVSQRHSSGRDGWVELVTSASDCHWGLVRECGGFTCLTS